MKPFLWFTPENFPNKYLGLYDRKRSPNRFLFRRGETVALVLSDPVIQTHASMKWVEQWDIFPNNAHLPLVNERALQIMQEFAGNDIQPFNVSIESIDGILMNYKLLNITKKVMCIYHKASKYDFVLNTNHIMGFNKLVLKEECCMTGSHIAREAEYLSNILVSPKLREAMLSAKVKGAWLCTPREVGW